MFQVIQCGCIDCHGFIGWQHSDCMAPRYCAVQHGHGLALHALTTVWHDQRHTSNLYGIPVYHTSCTILASSLS